ncbi:MAG: deoxyribose-phosphate aldolase, partial [Calditrichia bacterium]|nr:deoxyribose-phosphate aldolase [Calditrichia bacterium]
MSQENHTQSLKIAIGADHVGYELKEIIRGHLQSNGYELIDCGTDSTDPVDYPIIAYRVAHLVSEQNCQRGIIIDGAGIGSAIAANKLPGIRAALCYDLSSARNSREHNDANVLTLGAGLIGSALAKQISDIWLTTSCTVERYLNRVRQITDIEEGKLTVSQPDLEASQGTPEAVTSEPHSEDLQKIVDRIQSLLKEEFGVSLEELSTLKHQVLMDGRGVSVEKSPTAMRDFINMGVGRMTSSLGNGKDIPQDIAKYIDHTLLKPDATEEDIRQLCEEALQYNFASVCVNPTYISLAAKILRGSTVKVCSVVGFPFGTHPPEVKAMETRQAIREGAREIDMVINIGALKSGNDDLLYRDIRAVVEACDDGGAILKVIIEAALLTDDEKIKACQIARKAQADFVKTSTGFGP